MVRAAHTRTRSARARARGAPRPPAPAQETENRSVQKQQRGKKRAAAAQPSAEQAHPLLTQHCAPHQHSVDASRKMPAHSCTLTGEA